MKILVADDDALIRRLLTALLTKLGHEVEAVEDGEAALRSLESATPPDVAILDWVMPGMTGPDVCKRVRALPTRSRTYLLLLSTKCDKNDVIAGLDAGADDYLAKPFDPMGLMARLRVAQRTIAYQHELQQQIVQMETLLQRHNLLGELFGKQGRPADGPPSTAAVPKPEPKPAPVKKAGSAVPNAAMWSAARVNDMFIRALSEIGLGDAQAEILDGNRNAAGAVFTAWTPLVLPREELWLDLLLDIDDSSAVAQFEALLGRIPVSERELLDFLAETFNLLCTKVRNGLVEEGAPVLLPVISRSLRTASLNIRMPAQAEISRHRFSLPNIQLNLTAIRQAAPIVVRSLGQLRELDLLAENLPSPSTEEFFLLNQGVALNMRYIEKLSALAQAEKRDLRVSVIRPSPLTEFFCLGRIPG